MKTTLSHTREPAGIWPVLYAFFDSANNLDRHAMREQVRHVLAAGAPGIVVLGLATEVNRLSADEKREIVDWAVVDIEGRVPLAVTVTGDTVEEQVSLAEYALTRGAETFILQPPSIRGRDESFYFDFFCEIMRRIDAPCGIQNAPEYLGVGLSTPSLIELAHRRSNFSWLKCEGPALVVHATIEGLRAQDASLPVFNGRGGQELLDNLRAGCAGMIVAPDAFDRQVRIYNSFVDGQDQLALSGYMDILPEIVFVMQSLENLTCYGKRIAAWRMGLEVKHDRGTAPNPFGLACARRFASQLKTYRSQED